MSDAVAVEVAIDRPGDCPVAAASAAADEAAETVERATPAADGTVSEQFSLPAGTGPVDAGLGDGDAEPTPTGEDDRLRPIAETGDEAVYRFSRRSDRTCVCDAVERQTGPISEVSARDGTLFVSFLAADLDRVRAVVADLEESFDGVRVRRLVRTGPDDGDDSDPVVVDRGRLTARQREVLAVAHDRGYFDHPKGANAEEVADELGVASATFREHLAAAQRKLLDAVVAE